MSSWNKQLNLDRPQSITYFLPDFCTLRSLFLLIISTELLALVLALAPKQNFAEFWINLTNNSFACQAIALISAAGLCRLRTWLANMRTLFSTLTILAIIQLVNVLITSLTCWPIILDASNAMKLGEYISILSPNLIISSIVTLMALRYFYVQHQWKQNVEAEARARLWALQARIHPHFLFNTLNTIASLIRNRPEQAEQVVLDLADLLRSALANLERITLGDELELTRRYLAIESLRMGERLQIDWRLDNDLPLDMPLPALLLQPLVENAIHHGIQTLPEGGRLTICVEKQPSTLRFMITNPCLPADGQRFTQGRRLAQDNIRQRLRLLYGAAGQLDIAKTVDCYRVTFSIPLIE